MDEDCSSVNIISSNSGCKYFDEVIGQIEDIVLSGEFQSLYNAFLEAHWQSIEPTDENKLEYMDIFQKYTKTFETFFELQLKARMANFDMIRFASELKKNQINFDSEVNGEIFELLHSFSNFQAFKELLLDYRSRMEGKLGHLDFDILVSRKLCNSGDEA